MIVALLIASCASGCITDSTVNQTQSNVPVNSFLSLASASVTVGEPVSMTAVLKDDKNIPLNGKVVNWYIDGNYVGKSQVKDGSTAMSLSGSDTTLLGNKTHQIKVEFYGDAQYKSSTATTILSIKDIPTPVPVLNESTSPSEPSSVPEIIEQIFDNLLTARS